MKKYRVESRGHQGQLYLVPGPERCVYVVSSPLFLSDFVFTQLFSLLSMFLETAQFFHCVYVCVCDTIRKEIVKCALCLEPYRDPKVLACFHSFCKGCLEKHLEQPERIICPQCHMETQLSVQLGLDSLLTDFGLESVMNKQQEFFANMRLAENGGSLSTAASAAIPVPNAHLHPSMVAGSDPSNPVVGFGFGSPSSTTSSSSPPLRDSPTMEEQQHAQLAAMMAGIMNNNMAVASTGVQVASVPAVHCSGCKSNETATSFCQDCNANLCDNCTMAHKYMHCFAEHRVVDLSPPANAIGSSASSTTSSSPSSSSSTHQMAGLGGKQSPDSMMMGAGKRPVLCLQHRASELVFFCVTCNLAICRDCTVTDHPSGQHQYELIGEVAEKQMIKMEQLIADARSKHSEMLDMFKQVDSKQQILQSSHHSAHALLEETVANLISVIQEQKKVLAKEIDNAFAAKQIQLTMVDKRIQSMADKLSQTIEFSRRLLSFSSPAEVMVFKQLLDTRLQLFLGFNPDTSGVLNTACEIEYSGVAGLYNNSAATISQLLGTVRGGSAAAAQAAANEFLMPSAQTGMPPTPIGRVPSRVIPIDNQIARSPPHHIAGSLPMNAFSDSNLLRPNKDFGGSSQSLGPFNALGGSVPSSDPFSAQYDKWSLGVEPSVGGLIEGANVDEEKFQQLFPPSRSQIKRQKMIYHCKFGEFGVMEGQFTEPSGVAVNSQGDIVVADTNNHRIQVFDKEGRFKFQFGECGKRDGQLLYPNRVAVNRTTGDFVVTERSPTHQIQVYNQYGQFLRKFGANILQHPRGVCVDNKGRIIVVECKVMRVIIFDMFGNILQKFSCSRYLEFPNGVCTNDKNEILISDNRAHCIKVFSYEGQYLRQIGGEGVTNYPIGVGINSLGEVVVADNHNNFNLTVFSQDGTMIGALESRVKHAQCFDVALVDDGSVVLASKDYRLYLYRFLPAAASTGAGSSASSQI
ncbi:CBN-NCL-1 protein [Caenorhabditis brenneri]|uniref:CBN-NCL-1 protein n=1 Tax=Caenorhabditis brenneri TaxID=135651 RepID=G0MGM2_CAEBE|nr:CBN-NCL-1 protein [Caenorhabditis brenneri]